MKAEAMQQKSPSRILSFRPGKGACVADNRPSSRSWAGLIAGIGSSPAARTLTEAGPDTRSNGIVQRVSRDDYAGRNRQKFNLVVKMLQECRMGLSRKEIDRILRSVRPAEMNVILAWSEDKISSLPWNTKAFDILHSPASFSGSARYSDREMNAFRLRTEQERKEELDRLGRRRHVAKYISPPGQFPVGATELSDLPAAETAAESGQQPQGQKQVLKVGVSFRTDGRGTAHFGYDLKGIAAMNGLLPVDSPVRIEGVTLPGGAQGEATPERIAGRTELADIDMLYIPGGPTANDTQVGNDSEETGFKRAVPVAEPDEKAGKKKKDAYRVYREHASRSPYELELIRQARLKGIPILAVCGGSLRLLESYGGRSRTLPVAPRAVHTAGFGPSHRVRIAPGSLLGSVVGDAKQPAGPVVLEGVNSTHWATADTDAGGKLIKRTSGASTTSASASGDSGTEPGSNPADLLDVVAWAQMPEEKQDAVAASDANTGASASEEKKQDSVEAFEAKAGAPVWGIQWHPETYLEGMPGYADATPENRKVSADLFRFMADAARAAHNRQRLVEEFRQKAGKAEEE